MGSAAKFESFLEQARATRLTTILSAELYCSVARYRRLISLGKFGVESPLLEIIACGCGNNRSQVDGELCESVTALSGTPVYTFRYTTEKSCSSGNYF